MFGEKHEIEKKEKKRKKEECSVSSEELKVPEEVEGLSEARGSWGPGSCEGSAWLRRGTKEELMAPNGPNGLFLKVGSRFRGALICL